MVAANAVGEVPAGRFLSSPNFLNLFQKTQQIRGFR
jgi:hypothetical protein